MAVFNFALLYKSEYAFDYYYMIDEKQEETSKLSALYFLNQVLIEQIPALCQLSCLIFGFIKMREDQKNLRLYDMIDRVTSHTRNSSVAKGEIPRLL